MYRKKDGLSGGPLDHSSTLLQNGSLFGEDTFEPILNDDTFPDHPVADVLRLHKPEDGALVRQALMGHALDGQ